MGTWDSQLSPPPLPSWLTRECPFVLTALGSTAYVLTRPTEVLGNSRETGPSREARKSHSPREGISQEAVPS